MALMEKKQCDFCGNKIALLDETEYAEGYLCKECKSKLSPWFKDHKQATRQMLDEHFAYREANKAAVAAFHCTRSLGFVMGVSEENESNLQQYRSRLQLDDDARKFLVKRSKEDNPDVLDFSQITGCDYSERDSKHDDDTDTYYYLIINVDSPYFQEVVVSEFSSYDYQDFRAEANLMKEVINDIIREEHPETAEELSPSMMLKRRFTQPLPHPAPQPVTYQVPPQQSNAAPPPMAMQPQGMPAPMPQMQPIPMPQMQQPIPQPVQQQATPKFCRHCGNPLAPGVRFCTSCGGQILTG